MLIPAVIGALLLAVLSTAADYVWFLGIPSHHWYSGVIHGAVLFAALGGYLGFRNGKFGIGALGGIASGIAAAGSFYVLAPLGGYNVMVVSWFLLWIGLAIVQTSLEGEMSVARGVGRGIVTAIVAGLGFAVVLFQLYRGWPPPSFPAIKHFVAWSMAYFPGLYVLLSKPVGK
jgi:hypothetical protein